MRWSGLTPIGPPALASQNARRGNIQSRSRSCTIPSPQLELQHLDQPALGDVQYQDGGGDDGEHAQLIHEVVQVAPGQRVVERLVPTVESDLPIGRGDNDQRPLPRTRATSVLATGEPRSARIIMPTWRPRPEAAFSAAAFLAAVSSAPCCGLLVIVPELISTCATTPGSRALQPRAARPRRK